MLEYEYKFKNLLAPLWLKEPRTLVVTADNFEFMAW